MKTLIQFSSVGLYTTLIGFSTIYGCKYFFGIGDLAANATGYAVGLGLAFFLNRAWTFASTRGVHEQVLPFLTVMAVAYCANLFSVYLVLSKMAANSYVAHLAGIPPYFILGYLGQKYWVFRR